VSHVFRTRSLAAILSVGAFVLVSVAAAFGADGAANKRLPVPEAGARAKALATARDVFQSDLDSAKTPAEQAAVCDKIAKIAADSKGEPVERFVLLQLVVETATKAGDLPKAFDALEMVTHEYDVDEVTAKSRTLANIGPLITAKNFKEAFAAASELVDAAVSGDRFDAAKSVAQQLSALAQKFGDAAAKKAVLAKQAEVERTEKAYAEVPAAMKTLATTATDPAANLTVGKYELEKGDFEHALPYLAKSGDPAFQNIATKELAPPNTLEEQMAVADAWWDFAKTQTTPQKERMQTHAAEWYKRAQPEAKGLAAKMIEARLQEIEKPAKSASNGEAKLAAGALEKRFTNTIGMKLNLIHAGTFVMGSPDSEAGRSIETQHRVKISKPFYMGVYDVTRGEFAKFVAETKYQTDAEKNGKGSIGYDADGKFSFKLEYIWRSPGLFGNQQTDNHPVVSVSWADANAFCDWLSKKEGKKYRLPTEAEWEYACRAGTKTPYYFGTSLNGDKANCNGTQPFGTAMKGPYVKCTTPVGSYKPNAFGLYDLHGNVGQWCADWFEPDYYLNSPPNDPQGPNAGVARVVRGGGWSNSAMNCRSAFRSNLTPIFALTTVGFRVVLETSGFGGSP
jgi:formylglycine-generating enzyme